MKQFDWTLFVSLIPLLGAGLITMRPFVGEGGDYCFNRQIVWIAVSLFVFFVFSRVDWRFLKTSGLLLVLFVFALVVLGFLLVFGKLVRGSSSWLDFFFFSIQPSEPIKLLLILILAKYFSRRHIDIANFKHIFVSGIYAAIPAALIIFQPDFGSAVVFVLIWLGMVTVSGINKKHLLLVLLVFVLLFAASWFFVFKPYQKARIMTFLNPLGDPQGAGYNALQSMIAAGSGQIWGKGIGYGTQSRLNFLPEHRTDFIFAAFAEEWGFVGVLIIFSCFGVLIWRILRNAYLAQFNFEKFFAMGLSVFLMAHFVLHIGMNIGVLPITGLSMPFLSYGGSYMVTIFAGLGILMGFRKHSQGALQENTLVEFLGA
ncbi:rod shape-determining protein RodA [Patescibacteria group bacterium]|nr:rod shape-determining protein RodA [Patescibacteria group bacterium]